MTTLAKRVPESPSSLELHILSLILRGFGSKYEIQRKGGVSLGSSTPAIAKLVASGLLKQTDQRSVGSRIRHGLRLTAKGKKVLETGWRNLLSDVTPASIEEALRVVDLAKHQGAKVSSIAGYLRAVAKERSALIESDEATESTGHSILETRAQWSVALGRTEAKFLEDLADGFSRPAKKTARRRTLSS